MKAQIARTSTQKVKVVGTGAAMTPSAPITLKNQVTEIRSIEDITDVDEIDVSNGATLVYNLARDKYEVRKLDIGDLTTENIQLDGGEF